MRNLDDPVHGPWWYVSPSRLLRRVLVLAIGVGALVFGATEWVRHQWETAPTHYPDGSLLYPDGRLVHADGRVEYRKRRIVYPDGRVEYREWKRGR